MTTRNLVSVVLFIAAIIAWITLARESRRQQDRTQSLIDEGAEIGRRIR